MAWRICSKNRTNWSQSCPYPILYTRVLLISKWCSAVWIQLLVLRDRMQQSKQKSLLKSYNTEGIQNTYVNVNIWWAISLHVLWACWGQSHCSFVCPATPLSSSLRIPEARPRRTLTLNLTMSPCEFALERAGTVWPQGSLSQSCPGPWLLPSSQAQNGPLEEKEDPGPSRRDGHTGGTPPNHMSKRRLIVLQYSEVWVLPMLYIDKVLTFGVCLRLRASWPCSSSACRFRYCCRVKWAPCRRVRSGYWTSCVPSRRAKSNTWLICARVWIERGRLIRT